MILMCSQFGMGDMTRMPKYNLVNLTLFINRLQKVNIFVNIFNVWNSAEDSRIVLLASFKWKRADQFVDFVNVTRCQGRFYREGDHAPCQMPAPTGTPTRCVAYIKSNNYKCPALTNDVKVNDA